MRYPASEKLEIIRLVEQSHLPVRRTLDTARHSARDLLPLVRPLPSRRARSARGSTAPARAGSGTASPTRCASGSSTWPWTSRSCRRGSWPCASPTRRSYFVSEASVYRLLKAHDLITSPAFIVIKAADEFKDKTTAPNQLWQTDFTYLKVIGWGWFYLSTILDDFSRYIIAWKLCTTMRAEDVTDTLDLALQASGCDSATCRSTGHGCSATTARATSPATSPNGSRTSGMQPRPRRTLPSPDPGQDRALAPDAEEPHPARELLSCRAISKPRSAPSSTTTTTAATTRASATSPPPTSTSDAARPSCWNEKGSNDRPSNTDACSTASRRLTSTNRCARASTNPAAPSVSNI